MRTNSSSHLVHLFAAILLVCLPHLAAAQTAPDAGQRSSLSLEWDPMPFALGGYSFSVRYGTKYLPHWSVMGSLFSADFPDGMLSSTNRDAGWVDLHFGTSQALFVDYNFSGTGRGFFAGPSVFVYHNEVTYQPTGEVRSFTSIYPNLRFGYTWFPIKKTGFYLCPWMNIGRETIVGSQPVSEAPIYEMADIKYIVAIHVGYWYTF